MYKIDKMSYGFKLTFSDFITADEMEKWLKESEKVLDTAHNAFGVFVDMRSLKPLKPDAQIHMEAGQKLYKQKGMQRSAVVLNDKITTMQFRRIAKETGIHEWERYIDASQHEDWEQIAIKWIKDSIDPNS